MLENTQTPVATRSSVQIAAISLVTVFLIIFSRYTLVTACFRLCHYPENSDLSAGYTGP